MYFCRKLVGSPLFRTRLISLQIFAEIEQVGFSPASMPYGLEPTEDPTLQAQLFTYGASFIQMPSDTALESTVNNSQYLSTPSEIDFDLPRIFWNGLSEQDQGHLIYKTIWHLDQATDLAIRTKQCQIFYHVDVTLDLDKNDPHLRMNGIALSDRSRRNFDVER
ncbi:catalase-like domain-containing protein [Suillus spraguei]|nr:catalase-like domain-containing protein [Suillus spraguei]